MGSRAAIAARTLHNTSTGTAAGAAAAALPGAAAAAALPAAAAIWDKVWISQASFSECRPSAVSISYNLFLSDNCHIRVTS